MSLFKNQAEMYLLLHFVLRQNIIILTSKLHELQLSQTSGRTMGGITLLPQW